jgi:hypothetical protein
MALKRIDWNKQFIGLIFDEKNHSYTYEDKEFISVTTLLDKVKTKIFDDNFKIVYAKKHNLPVEFVDSQWKIKADVGAVRGTETHLFAENFIKYGLKTEVSNLSAKNCNKLLNFFNDYKTTKFLLSEYRVFDLDTMIAGTIDCLAYDFKTQEYIIYDFKTNKNLSTFDKTRFKSPLHDLQQTDINTYTLQLNIYKHIIEKHTGIQISKLRLININDRLDNYELIELKTEYAYYTNLLLDYRKEMLK